MKSGGGAGGRYGRRWVWFPAASGEGPVEGPGVASPGRRDGVGWGGVAAGPASLLGPAAPLRVPRLPPAPHSCPGSMAGRGPGCSLQLPAGTQPPGGGHLYPGESEGPEEESEVFELRPRGREKVRRSTSRDRLDGIILLTKDIQEGDTLNAIALQYCCSVSPRWPALLAAFSRVRSAASGHPAARLSPSEAEGPADPVGFSCKAVNPCVAFPLEMCTLREVIVTHCRRWSPPPAWHSVSQLLAGRRSVSPSPRCPCLPRAGRGRDLCCSVGSQLCQLLTLQLYEGQR